MQTGVKLGRVWAQREDCACSRSGGPTGSPQAAVRAAISKDMGRATKALPIYYIFCAVVQGMVLEDDAGNGENEYWDTGPGRQRQEERYWDTCDVWQKGDRFHVTCLQSRHYGRYGAVIGVSETRLTVVFDDRRPGQFIDRGMVVHAPRDWCWLRRYREAQRTLSWW
jgi:hypothetical protein